jgi:hypothetical protein
MAGIAEVRPFFGGWAAMSGTPLQSLAEASSSDSV